MTTISPTQCSSLALLASPNEANGAGEGIQPCAGECLFCGCPEREDNNRMTEVGPSSTAGGQNDLDRLLQTSSASEQPNAVIGEVSAVPAEVTTLNQTWGQPTGPQDVYPFNTAGQTAGTEFQYAGFNPQVASATQSNQMLPNAGLIGAQCLCTPTPMFYGLHARSIIHVVAHVCQVPYNLPVALQNLHIGALQPDMYDGSLQTYTEPGLNSGISVNPSGVTSGADDRVALASEHPAIPQADKSNITTLPEGIAGIEKRRDVDGTGDKRGSHGDDRERRRKRAKWTAQGDKTPQTPKSQRTLRRQKSLKPLRRSSRRGRKRST